MKYTTISEAVSDLLKAERLEPDQISWTKGAIETDESMQKQREDGRFDELCGLMGALSTRDGQKGAILLVVDMRETQPMIPTSQIERLGLQDMEPTPIRRRVDFRKGDLVVHPDYGSSKYLLRNGEFDVIRPLSGRQVEVVPIHSLKVHPDFDMGHEIIE